MLPAMVDIGPVLISVVAVGHSEGVGVWPGVLLNWSVLVGARLEVAVIGIAVGLGSVAMRVGEGRFSVAKGRVPQGIQIVPHIGGGVTVLIWASATPPVEATTMRASMTNPARFILAQSL